MGSCSADFQRLAQQLGEFGCEGQNAFVNLHNPFGLDHWTMLLFEIVTVLGAVLALRHALRLRRQGDPTVLALWIASLAYLAIVEPPLYFPDAFGLQEQTGLIFVHNEFTVQFMWGRLPLYIVAIYPVMVTLAYEVVRQAGVFARRGPFVSAITVGFVYHVFYEFFDHVGPQLRWWIWNPTAPSNEPFLASVPISSMVTFAVAGPVALTFLVRVLVARHPQVASLGTGPLVGRSVLAGLLMPIGLVLGGMPATIFTFAEETNRTGQAIAYWTVLGLVTVVAVPTLISAVRSRQRGEGAEEGARRYLLTHAGIYLGALVVSWAAALPDYVDAVDSITADGTPIGSLPYALACLVVCIALLVLVVRRGNLRDADILTPLSEGSAVSV
ncbi:MAG: hypothetical protein R3249_11565 [Nitriliruptorales bacterium]|nr:hypothetical protein [Nitriliruptorales bacterium]